MNETPKFIRFDCSINLIFLVDYFPIMAFHVVTQKGTKNNTLGTETSFETASGPVYNNVNELLRRAAKKLHLPRLVNLTRFLN